MASSQLRPDLSACSTTWAARAPRPSARALSMFPSFSIAVLLSGSMTVLYGHVVAVVYRWYVIAALAPARLPEGRYAARHLESLLHLQGLSGESMTTSFAGS